MASDSASLHSLEALMNEFFSGTTGNQRKREIEQVLHNFGQQSGAWHHCVYFMGHSSNHYVLMYAISVFENLINKQWLGIQSSDKTEIRNFLNQYLLTHHKALPSFVRNKLVKVIVDVGRIDWPHFYYNFFTNIIELIQQPSTTTLGLIMLHTTSEEMASPREDLSIARRNELHRLLLNQVPGVLTLIGQLLERILERHRRVTTTVTPPPSPTHGISTGRSASPIITGRLLNQSPKLLQLPALDPESEEISSLALKCLSHLFSWIPLSSTITPQLLGTVFYFAEFGCCALSGSNGSIVGNPQLGVLAMTCINELLSKNCVPAEFEEFLLKLFQQTFQLLQRITKEGGVQSIDSDLSELDESYISKFTEFLCMFVSIHLRRFENSSHFPVLELLTLLFKYTFKQPDNEGLFSCLDIWAVFLDYLTSKVSNARSDKLAEAEATVSRYKEVLMLLLNELIKKIQFHHNPTFLEELDDQVVDDNSETEWQAYQRNLLEIISKIAELLPSEAFSLLFPLFNEYSKVYHSLEPHITKTPQGVHLNISSESEFRQLHWTLRDLSTLERALGRLVDHFIGEVNFSNRFSDGEAIVERLCRIALFSTQSKIYCCHVSMQSVLNQDLIEVHAQSLASLQAYCHWLSQFYIESHRQQQHQNKFATLVSSAVDALIPLLDKDVSHRVVLPACHLLNSLTSTVRPSFLTSLDKIQTLFHTVSTGGLAGLPLEVQTLVYRSLSNALVLPWPLMSDNKQEWEMRSQNHKNLIKGLCRHYKELIEIPRFSDNKQLQDNAKSTLQFTLHILHDIVLSVSDVQVTKTKVILCQSIQEDIQMTLTVFPVYAHQPDAIDAILSFLLALFESLKIQIGSSMTEQIVHHLMSIFTREQLSETILHESSTGSKVVEKFLKILQLLIQAPAASFKAFLPGIISLCMEQLYPILAESSSSPDIKTEFFELLHQLLLHNWRYFFRSSLLAQMSGHENVENQPQFISMLQAFGQSFLQPDIAIFKQNLEILENLNSKCKLYQKDIFRDHMLLQFINVLFQALVYRSHDLLQEEITITIYNMASVDFDKFYSSFLTEFLKGSEGLTENQKSELSSHFKLDKDLPSFTQNIHRFVGDLRYYRLCNSSLPPGTVKF
ncbi:exportin-6-like [Actinia tenebrosa]|uniref:Exportin-6-like n=1 Tax=Actinia tenebrosa TaxID=6105 RepID=A0A6P8IXL8_ACTTE|nr:exportin-6-like [Actinia tenebrosa]